MAVYYVATDGNNGNAGLIGSPWLEPNYGALQLNPGDILYVRAGTYTSGGDDAQGDGGNTHALVAISGKDGSPSLSYTIAAYPSEEVIFSGTSLTMDGDSRSVVLLSQSSYWHIKGIIAQHADQDSGSGSGGSGIQLFSGHHNLIEQCIARYNGGPGFYTRIPSGNENNFLNCDAYYNYDPYSGTPGDDADGFDIGFGSADHIQRLTGCRSWDNSDDGFDMYQYVGYSGIYYLIDCWAWRNGYIPGTSTPAGDGNGFKYGLDGQGASSVTKRYSINCIASNNRQRGFSQESANVKKEFYHCLSLGNGSWGFSFIYFDIPDIIQNCVAIDDGVEDIGTNRISSYNSWDLGITVGVGDIDTDDYTLLDTVRQSNGNLPVIPTFHLTASSQLRGVGITVSGYTLDGDGQPWNVQPSVGVFDYNPVVVIPVESIVLDDTIIIITQDDGTLQMIATVSPSNATYLTVNWEVLNGTGSASISSTGLLTAISNGTVTVRAVAKDTSGIYATLEITLSNQFGIPAVTKQLAPMGWHIPTDIEWQELIDALQGNALAGGYLKEVGFDHWTDPNTGADNSSGFTALGAGFRSGVDGVFYNLNEYSRFWASNSPLAEPQYPYGVYLSYDAMDVNIYSDGPNINDGLSVRAIKNDSTYVPTVMDIDGNVYPVVRIGTQVWMAENLRVTHYTDGTPIPNVTDDAAWMALTTGAMCWYNNVVPLPAGGLEEGALYSGDEDPTGTKRLNYDGYFYATKLVADDIQINSLPAAGVGDDYIVRYNPATGKISFIAV